MICDICVQSTAWESIMREWTIQLVVLFNPLYIQIHVMMLRGMQIPWSSFEDRTFLHCLPCLPHAVNNQF